MTDSDKIKKIKAILPKQTNSIFDGCKYSRLVEQIRFIVDQEFDMWKKSDKFKGDLKL